MQCKHVRTARFLAILALLVTVVASPALAAHAQGLQPGVCTSPTEAEMQEFTALEVGFQAGTLATKDQGTRLDALRAKVDCQRTEFPAAAVPAVPDANINESFDAVTFPPTDWVRYRGTNGLGTVLDWVRTTASTHTGAGAAFVSYENVTGGSAEDWLVTPKLRPDVANATLSFWQRQAFTSNFGSMYYIKVSTTSQTNQASFTDVTSYNETTFSTTYTNKTVDLSAYNGTDIYVAFVMVNDDGDSWYVDDVTGIPFAPVATPPNCATSFSPADTATNVAATANLTWASGGGSPTGYKIFFGTDNPPTNIANGSDLGLVTTYDPLGNMAYSTLHYWKIVPYNANGDATGCSVLSFTTGTTYSGSYNVGAGEPYTSLTNAGGIFEAINAGALTGNVTINITTDLSGELGTNALNQWAEDGVGGYTMLIKPSGAPRLITGTNTGALIKLNGADRVRIDGWTGATFGETVGGNPALRELTIQNTNTGTSAFVIAVQSGTNGAQNNTIKNVNVLGQDPLTTLGGIALGGNTPGTAGTDNDGNRVENCTVKRAIYGIYSAGASAANPNIGTVITQNDLSATTTDRIRRVGIVVFNENGVQITENSVGGLDTNEGADGIGIGVGTQGVDTTLTTSGGVTNAFVSRNKVNGVNSASTVGYSAAGIAVAGATGGANTIVNNMITGVTSPATSPDLVAGIYVVGAAGSVTQLYYNSVSMTGDRGAVTIQTPSYGLAVTGTDPTVVAKDNIFYTTQIASGGGVNAKSYAIGMVTTTFVNLDSNYNVFYISGTNAGGYRTGGLGAAVGTDYATLATWQAAVADDASSIQADPVFVDPLNNLHINPSALRLASPVSGAGTPIAGINDDFDGDPRNPVTPDIGADEFAPLAVTLASFGAQGGVDRVTVNWQTLSEANNAGFNVYRADDAAGPQTLLAYIPSQSPGSTQGFAYTYDDLAVQAGRTYWYWLEAVSLGGATTLFGPVSATVSVPTAVTLASLQATPADPVVPPALAGLAALAALAGAALSRRRR